MDGGLMEQLLRSNYNFFEKLNPGTQNDKMLEESKEVTQAIEEYIENPNEDTFDEVISEVSDELSLIYQKALKMGMSIDYIDSKIKHNIIVKGIRTKECRIKMKNKGCSYNEARYGTV